MSELPRVLLLGDSNGLSYQSHVAAMLSGRATVVGPADNARFALCTLCRLDDWFAECGHPNLVHWNNGLWDLGRHVHRAPSGSRSPSTSPTSGPSCGACGTRARRSCGPRRRRFAPTAGSGPVGVAAQSIPDTKDVPVAGLRSPYGEIR